MGKEHKNLALAATIICLVVALLHTLSSPFESWKLRLTNGRDTVHGEDTYAEVKEEEQIQPLRRLVRGEERIQLETTGFSCHSDLHTDLCVANKPVRIDNNGLSVYITGFEAKDEQKIRPYARNDDPTAMERVTALQIIHGNSTPPPCHYTHNDPAMIFSSGGFTGNLFHEINEVIIPLFLTSRHFQSHLHFVITDFKPWWVSKYNKIISYLSHYKVINPAADTDVHCFPGAVIGLMYHDNLAINRTEIPGGYSMFDFRHFLRQSYNLKIKHVSEIEKPVLVLISRRKSRKFLNEIEMVEMMEELGFQVITAKPNRMSNLDKFAEVLNYCSVMIGAHGAGLTNEVFLPDGAVMVQVVPLGLEWASANYYGDPTTKMGINYLEYKIEAEESSLLDQYGPDHPVIADPKSIFLQGYDAARSVYVDGQNMKINVVRFKETLVQAMKLVGR
ncbi:hypothetical protein K2173_023787 [Erythroxylum novogranatense]|uniref:Glycosyltransferase 61 catalytic domain-containing protein n=1 Tax=Erythroxylum novogranatense TaxID=1862640 RepID=A0AAV8TI68_9ROSI|nr:hypothetical protein K2173_023787 [Erythroxylum novogranatense]